ncbi:helix-turn-helix domain-containing protein [Leucothrix pacifica]|uniref:Putative Fis-like DNA-binding protein n=1 Tax=Leucothrix pacifica TaxID=1247513 RepID=A0A317C8M3_9GAMM|nr:helix-turn-helix domain-containing protein [Leucothrix pacifica]PWQ94944.1 Fis family transcriptional regulator [Leucothrix pacifica]
MTNTPLNADSLSEATDKAVSEYLDLLGDHDATNLYRQVVDEVERPLLEVIMKHTRGNQSKAAMCLGMNRATLRSKLKRHGLL